MRLQIPIYFLLISLVACQSNTSSIPESKAKIKIDSKTNNTNDTKDEYSFIKSIVQKDDSIFINADFIQFLTGDQAIEAAKRLHEADTFKTEDGVTHIDVPNDYFILNESHKIRKLYLVNNAIFELLIGNPDREHPIFENNLTSLKKVFADSPFILTIKNGSVTKVKEVFLP